MYDIRVIFAKIAKKVDIGENNLSKKCKNHNFVNFLRFFFKLRKNFAKFAKFAAAIFFLP